MAVQAKQLQLHFAFSDDGMVTADESRIAQVIENFAQTPSNTPRQAGR